MKITTLWEIAEQPIHYLKALEAMESYVDDIINNTAPNKIWLLEHFDVYTGGSSSSPEDIIAPKGIEIINTNRGGKFTYHGIGQRIIYPMINLNEFRDIKLYIASLENWIISTLQDFNLDAFKKDGMIGIWVLDSGVEKKIGAIGVRVKKWVAYHGIAININPDIAKFSGIVPCGISNFGVTSLQKLKKDVSFKNFDISLKNNFNKVFN
ncbi:MAG: lipoyl(octanoyl) transferase LipB [Alphaproteobacteria bacterium]|jgi:lipoyl(octanoyl) transferase|nr:lipoyl(octanoyl) transferase LipB [Alphaproteobacteria bacterium]